jgi:hypothetical protein
MDGSRLTDRAGYYIYYGTDPENLSGTIDQLGSGTYYFRVQAYTATGIRGASSITVSKVIP